MLRAISAIKARNLVSNFNHMGNKRGYTPAVGEEYAAYRQMSGKQVDASDERERALQDPKEALLRYAAELEKRLKFTDHSGGKFLEMVRSIMSDLAKKADVIQSVGLAFLVDHAPKPL